MTLRHATHLELLRHLSSLSIDFTTARLFESHRDNSISTPVLINTCYLSEICEILGQMLSTDQ